MSQGASNNLSELFQLAGGHILFRECHSSRRHHPFSCKLIYHEYIISFNADDVVDVLKVQEFAPE